MQRLAMFLATGAVAVRSERALAEDEFEDRLEGWDARCDYDDVGLNAVRSVSTCFSQGLGSTYLVHMTRSAVPSSSVSGCETQCRAIVLTRVIGLVGQALELRTFDNGHCRGTGMLAGLFSARRGYLHRPQTQCRRQGQTLSQRHMQIQKNSRGINGQVKIDERR